MYRLEFSGRKPFRSISGGWGRSGGVALSSWSGFQKNSSLVPLVPQK